MMAGDYLAIMFVGAVALVLAVGIPFEAHRRGRRGAEQEGDSLFKRLATVFRIVVGGIVVTVVVGGSLLFLLGLLGEGVVDPLWNTYGQNLWDELTAKEVWICQLSDGSAITVEDPPRQGDEWVEGQLRLSSGQGNVDLRVRASRVESCASMAGSD